MAALPLHTKRLTLRAYRDSDVNAFLAIYSRPDVARYLLEEPWTRQYAEHKVAERIGRTGLDTAEHALALVMEVDDAVIGTVSLWTEGHPRCAEIGWTLDPDHGGRGLATEAVSRLLAHGFEECGVHRIEAQMDARNTPSARLAKRIGMTREAHLRQN